MEVWVHRLQHLLSEDPVLHVAEFEGSFQLDARSHLFRRIVIEGHYEPALSQLCRTHAAPDRDAIDIGANAGFFSVLLARLLNSRRVVAVEPSPMMLPRLHANLARNGVTGQVTVYEGALSDVTGTAQLNSVDGLEEYGTLGQPAHPSILDVADAVQSRTVQTCTLDELVLQHGLSPGFIKMDVEGAEALVFRGARQTLEAHRPVVLSELSDGLLRANGSSAMDVLGLLRDAGYRTLDPRWPDLPEVTPSETALPSEILCVPEESSR